MDTPKTLLEAIKFFSEYENCRQYMIDVRWADGIVRCPTCGSDRVTYMEKARLYNCRTKHSKQKFSLKVGTIYEDSAIGLEKWLPTTWLLSNCKSGISSYELARALGVTQKSAWHMLHRIRKAMEVTGDAPMGGEGKTVVRMRRSWAARSRTCTTSVSRSKRRWFAPSVSRSTTTCGE